MIKSCYQLRYLIYIFVILNKEHTTQVTSFKNFVFLLLEFHRIEFRCFLKKKSENYDRKMEGNKHKFQKHKIKNKIVIKRVLNLFIFIVNFQF